MREQYFRKPSLPTLFSVLVAFRCFSATTGLDVAVITGTTRTQGPPWPILGPRVAAFVVRNLERRGHRVSTIDLKESKLPLLEKPHFAYAKSQQPPELNAMHQILSAADAYVVITPEYNHFPSPALISILNHFGSSTFSFKPSAIVSYSAGQWGGARAATALRPLLSELGCLPVSAMVHLAKPQYILTEEGDVVHSNQRDQWDGYLGRCLSQLEWWGEAAKTQRSYFDPFESSPAFKGNPEERNAPQ